MAKSTVSQCPLFMSEVKLSMESTVLSVIPKEGQGVFEDKRGREREREKIKNKEKDKW